MAAITAPIPMAAAPPNEPIDATMAAGVHAAVVAAAEETLAAVVVAVPATAAEVVAAVAAICAAASNCGLHPLHAHLNERIYDAV
jgi:molybdopterin-guanine dinucleotide biosynthesis protein A